MGRIQFPLEAVRRIGEVLIVLLAVSFLLEWGLALIGRDRAVVRKEELRYASTRDLPRGPAADLSSYEKTVGARNLFQSRPLEPEGLGPRRIEELSKHLSLIGVIETEIREAFLKDGQTNLSLFVREGSEVGPLKVKKIKSRSLVLSLGSEEKEIFLE